MRDDGFHPDLQPSDPLTRHRVHHVKSSEIDSDTAQSEAMQRFAAISGRTVGSENLWMGATHVRPQTVSANHHHGESERQYLCAAAIPTSFSTTASTKSASRPVPATTSSYRRICLIGKNPRAGEPAVVVIARTTQEAIVVNLPELYAL